MQLFKDFTAGKLDGFSQDSANCIKNEIKPADWKKMLGLVQNSKNFRVVANLMAPEEDHSEDCAHYDFYIYRANGEKVMWTFNHTD